LEVIGGAGVRGREEKLERRGNFTLKKNVFTEMRDDTSLLGLTLEQVRSEFRTPVAAS